MTFEPNLDELVGEMLVGVQDFAKLTRDCHGAYPGKIKCIIEQIAGRSTPISAAANAALQSSSSPRSRKPYWDRRLPLPHPLDDDWRFSPSTADALLKMGLAAAGEEGSLLLAAVPTIALRALDLALVDRVVFAARLDDPVTRAILRVAEGRLRVREIRDGLSDLGCSAAICDPPWSDPIARPIILATASGVRPGQPILICVPGRFTGASQADQLANLPRHSGSFGLGGAKFTDIEVRYETPLFEVNALIAEGVTNFDPDWRTGRLIAAVSADTIERSEFPSSEWVENALGSMRLFSRLRPGCQGDEAIFRIVPSISRTHPSRSDASGWTSGNRALRMGAQIRVPASPTQMPRWLARLAAAENADAEILLRLDP